MAGVFTNKRVGLVSKTGHPTTWTDNFFGTLNTLYLPSGRPFNSLSGAKTISGNTGTIGPMMTLVPMASVTSYRSGRGWDSKIPDDPRSYANDLINQSKGSAATDRGHEFNSVKQQLISFDANKSIQVTWSFGASRPQVYTGDVAFNGLDRASLTGTSISKYFTSGGQFIFPTVPDVSPTYGTKLVAAANPTKANASLMTAILELKDGIPKFPGLSLGRVLDKKELARAGSDEFLNYVFGIVPAVGDIKKLLKSIVNFNNIVNQYARDSNNTVRRRKGLPAIVSTDLVSAQLPSNTVAWYPVSSMSNVSARDVLSGTSTISVSDHRFDKIWFSGAFMYHLPLGSDAWSNMDRLGALANKLLGSNLDGHNLWQALPWSWLLDWFVNVGDIIQNSTQINQYGGVMKYGYLMCESTYNRIYTASNLNFVNGYKTELSTSLMTKRKQRIRATPFGFGLNPGTFSDQQWAILGALGISKGPKSLW